MPHMLTMKIRDLGEERIEDMIEAMRIDICFVRTSVAAALGTIGD